MKRIFPHFIFFFYVLTKIENFPEKFGKIDEK